jgi:hypothetical protein
LDGTITIFSSTHLFFVFLSCTLLIALVFALADWWIKQLITGLGLNVQYARVVYALLAAVMLVAAALRGFRIDALTEASPKKGICYRVGSANMGQMKQPHMGFGFVGFLHSLRCNVGCSMWMFALLAMGTMELLPMLLATLVDVGRYCVGQQRSGHLSFVK